MQLVIIVIVIMCLTVATKSQSEVTHNFATSDMVEVCEGELIHLQGRVIRIDGNKITMLPKHEDLKVSYHLLAVFIVFSVLSLLRPIN